MKSSKVGAVVLATDQGLGYLAKSYFDHGLIDYVYIHPHSSRTNHYEWYPAERTLSEPADLFKCDTIVFFEEPFHWKLIPQARERGITTVLMVMYECTRNPLPYVPDVILCPSSLDLQYYPDGKLHTVPVEVPWRQRNRAHTFVHNAGNGGLGGRNGTREVIEAWKHVQSPAKLILRSQIPVEADDPRIEVRVGQFDDIWDEGDVFIFPEKFNGLSLPLQEAYASGMLVMAGDRFPINTWLPKEPLIPVEEYVKDRISVEFESARYNPLVIGRKIDEWYGKDISEYSRRGKEWAESNTWKVVDKSIFDPIVKTCET
jgi:hypothetical protein